MISILKRVAGFIAVASVLTFGQAFAAGDPPQCKQVRFSDVGWSCITATTAIAANLLEGLGYKPKINVLSGPVTFHGLRHERGTARPQGRRLVGFR